MEEEEIDDIKKSLQEIKEKVNAIDEKTNNKWVLPVLIVVLTAVLGWVNYIVEKNIDKNFIEEVRKKELLADLITSEKKNFYSNAKLNLLKLNELFEEYCIFLDDSSEKKVDDFLPEFMLFYSSQQFIEEEIIKKLKDYSEYISEGAHMIKEQNFEKAEIDKTYMTSKNYLNKALTQIEIGLKQLEK